MNGKMLVSGAPLVSSSRITLQIGAKPIEAVSPVSSAVSYRSQTIACTDVSMNQPRAGQLLVSRLKCESRPCWDPEESR